MNDCRVTIELNQYQNGLWECDCENESELCDNCLAHEYEYFEED